MCEEIQQEKWDENQIGQNEKDELEEINEDVSCTQLPTDGNGGEGLPGRKRKKNNNSSEDNITHTMREVGNLLAANLITALNNLSKAVTKMVVPENRLK
jgi:hypothetical protein